MKRDFFRFFKPRKRRLEFGQFGRLGLSPTPPPSAPEPSPLTIFPELPQNKPQLRRHLKQRLAQLTPTERAAASLHICQHAADLPAFERASCIAFFSALPTEPDLTVLIELAWAERKRVTLPCIVPCPNDESLILEWRSLNDWDELIETSYAGLQEPNPRHCPLIDLATLDCIFVPGLAFDPQGTRLGRGGGFYDRFLKDVPPETPCPGVMFGCQRVEKIPREAHDIALRSVITEWGCQVLS